MNHLKKSVFPLDDKSWDSSTLGQRLEWLEKAKEADVEFKELDNQAKEQLEIMNNAVVAIYGKPNNTYGHAKTSHRLQAYLKKNMPDSYLYRKKMEGVWEDRNRSYQTRLSETIQAQHEKANAAQQKADSLQAIIEVTQICLRHGIDTALIPDYDSIMSLLLAKDKYLNLGYAGLWTRNDWNDGYGKVKTALESFAIEKWQDAVIEGEWGRIVDGTDYDYHIDGRYFRDAEWDYNRVMGLCDNEQLDKDAEYVNGLLDY